MINFPFCSSSGIKQLIVKGSFVTIIVISLTLFLAVVRRSPLSPTHNNWEETYFQVNSAQVFVNGHLSPASKIYRANDKCVLVKLNDANLEIVYVILPETNEVYWADGFSFAESSGKMRLAKLPPHIKPINMALAGTKPDLIFGDNYLEFKVVKEKLVSVTW